MTNPLTILIVEDDAGVRFVLTENFQDSGYTVVQAANGHAALRLLREQPVDLVLTDLRMPVMGGLELLLELRARGYALPVYVMSSGTNHGAEATAYGANGFLPKHLGLDKLPALVTRLWLEGYPAGGRVSEPAARDQAERRPVVVLNSNDDLLVLLAEISESAGFEVVTAHTMEIGREVEAIRDFLRRHNPRVVVYDVSPPYPENWELYRKLHDSEVRGGTGRHFVVTTPNKAALEDHVGATSAIELVGDRVDRAAIARAIQQAMLV